MSPAQRVLLVNPGKFYANPQTMPDNAFQKVISDPEESNRLAGMEFEGLKKCLIENGIGVEEFRINDSLETPDAVFPNNWFSTHPGGIMVLYPMKYPNRRLERRPEIISKLSKSYPQLIDLSRNEERGLFLEGTGSIVIDHVNKRAFMANSERSSSNLLYEWSKRMNYEKISFSAYDKSGKAIYHTNVMLSIGEGFCVLCLDAVPDPDERRILENVFLKSGHEMILINQKQLENFCANCIQLSNVKGERILFMSERAYEAFEPSQLNSLEKHTRIVQTPLHSMEAIGGGSLRCMIAELY